MKTILAPTDFSDCAANALDFAVQSAKLLPARILLLHAFEFPGTNYTDYMGVNREFRQDRWNEDSSRLVMIKETLEKVHGVEVETRLAAASLITAIGEIVDSQTIDLIVMGTLGASGPGARLWGSHTADVISMSSVPVLAIPIDYKWKKPEKVLLATGNFEKDPAILDKIFELAGLYMAKVDVVVFTDERDEPATFIEHGRGSSYYADMLVHKYDERELHIEQLFGKDLEHSLQEYIKDNHIDVLVMIMYQRGFWDRLFHPSQTKRMSFHTKVPLLAVPGGKT